MPAGLSRVEAHVADAAFPATPNITNPLLQPATDTPNNEPGYFSTNREKTKRTKYGQVARIHSARVILLVLETYG